MSERDNLFKRIICGEIPASKVYEDDEVLAFHDIAPVAPTHILIIPKAGIDNLNELTEASAELAGKLLLRASLLAKSLGFSEDGYRVVINTNEDGGQTVPHLHAHLLAGRRLTWKA